MHLHEQHAWSCSHGAYWKHGVVYIGYTGSNETGTAAGDARESVLATRKPFKSHAIYADNDNV
jgi:hypothetical protein